MKPNFSSSFSGLSAACASEGANKVAAGTRPASAATLTLPFRNRDGRHAVGLLLVGCFVMGCCGPLRLNGHPSCCHPQRHKARSGEAPGSGGVKFRMIGFDGRHQWRRHQLFKLRAKLTAVQKEMDHKWLAVRPRPASRLSASKICDLLNYCALRNNWADRAAPVSGGSHFPKGRCESLQNEGFPLLGPEIQWHVDCIHWVASQRRLRSTGLLKPLLAETYGTSSGHLAE